jgi:hypothetical protein
MESLDNSRNVDDETNLSQYTGMDPECEKNVAMQTFILLQNERSLLHCYMQFHRRFP